MSEFKSSAERIKLARNMLGLSRKVMEEQFHISADTMQSWELGRNPLTSKGAKRLSSIFICQGLLCSDEWLLTGAGQFPTFLNTQNLSSTLTEDIRIIRETEAFMAINPDSIVVIMPDDGMLPIYSIGDYVAGNKKYNQDISSLIGKHCIIETSQGDIFIRKLLSSKKQNYYNLACINIHSMEAPIILNIKLNYAAQIVWHRIRSEPNEK